MSAKGRRNLVIGQSGGATAVINASLVGAFETARENEHFDEIYGMRYGIEGLLKEDLIDLRRQPASLWPRLRTTPGAALGSCRYKLKNDDPEHILALFQHYQIHDMLYLGGNDSAETSHRLAQAAQQQGYDLRVISVPKTIDNDLPYTDHCPGYGTAARFIALATMHATMNMLALPKEYPVKFIETMGRDAGWLVAASALGKREEHDSPHLLLCPEHAFNEDAFLKQVETIYQQLGYVVIVSAEALRDENGQPVGALVGTDAFGHTMVSGVAERLTEIVRNTLHLRASFDRPGDIQWNGISRTDSDEAYMVGQAAVRALLEGKSDLMVTLVREEGPAYRCTTGSIELSKVADQQRLLPDTFLNESKTMVTRSFYDYALPLLGDPLPNYPKFEGNMPPDSKLLAGRLG